MLGMDIKVNPYQIQMILQVKVELKIRFVAKLSIRLLHIFVHKSKLYSGECFEVLHMCKTSKHSPEYNLDLSNIFLIKSKIEYVWTNH